MSDYPVIFSAPMVRALLDGRKSMTRRLAWNDAYQRIPKRNTSNTRPVRCKANHPEAVKVVVPSPWQKVVADDRLWVRENFAKVPASAYRRSEGVAQTICPDDRDFSAIYAAGWDRSIPKWTPCHPHAPMGLAPHAGGDGDED